MSSDDDDKAGTHLRWCSYFSPDQAEIFVARWNWEGEYPQHDHDFLEIVVCVGGENRHRSIRGEERFAAGDVYVMRPGTWHVMTGKQLVAYNCCFGLKLLWGELAWTLDDASLNPLLWSGPLSPGNDGILHLSLDQPTLTICQERMDTMMALGNRQNPRLHARRIGLLTLLLSDLAAALPEREQALARTHPAVLQSLRQLHEQLAHAWTMEQLCEHVQLEESYLTRLFREATGLPPMAYLARLRAEKAASLLLRTQWPIARVAAAVGWEDPNYFARRFRQHFGISASAYREQFVEEASS